MAARSSNRVSEYNRDQLTTVLSIRKVLSGLTGEEMAFLRSSIRSYLGFRRKVGDFFESWFRPSCQELCFGTGVSACCGFESIITFFADHVINLMESSCEQVQAFMATIERPNSTQRCVYLGPTGCIWSVLPVSCAMFLCARVKEPVFDLHPPAQSLWSDLQQREKDFTFPDKPVLFDVLEAFFMKRGSESCHLFYHRSPGLLRIKSRAGLHVPAR